MVRMRRVWKGFWSILLMIVASGAARAQCVGPPGDGEWDNLDRAGDPPHLSISVASCPDVNPAPGATVRYSVQSWWRRPNGSLATHPAAPGQVQGGTISARVQNGPNVDRMTIRPVAAGGQRFIDVTILRQNIDGSPPATLTYRFRSTGRSRPDPNAVMLTPTYVNTAPLTGAAGGAKGTVPFGIGDWDGDGHKDLVLVTAAGDLMLYPGAGGRGRLAAAPIRIGNGWNGYTFFGLGDWDGDGHLDIIVRRDSNGDLMLYPGEGTRAYSHQQPVKIGNGWSGYTFFGMIDWDRDGKLDIVTRQDSSGNLMLYPGEGTRAYSSQQPVKIQDRFQNETAFGAIDWDGDGFADIIARTGDGDLVLYLGNGGRRMMSELPVRIGNGWGPYTPFGIGDWDGDGKADILARASNGDLMLYPGEGTRAYSRQQPARIASGF